MFLNSFKHNVLIVSVIDCGEVDLGVVPASVMISQPPDNYFEASFTIDCGAESEVLSEIDKDCTSNCDRLVVCKEDGNWDFGSFRCLGML